MERKRFLRMFATVAASGPLLVEACKKDSAASTQTNTDSTLSGTSSGNGCIVSATETEGPFPYPGGEATNPLSRADVTGGQTGVPLTLNFVVTNANNNCNVIPNARVDIWHCNKDGYYSGYANQPGLLGTQSYVGQTWLRGYQTTNANGQTQFATIYPGWYSGRATHIHIEVYVNNVLKKTTQITFSETISDVVHVSTLYAAHGKNTTRNVNDGVFGDSATDLANETMALTGSVAAGFSGSFTIGLAL